LNQCYFFKDNITFLLLNQNVHTHITINSLSKQCYLLLLYKTSLSSVLWPGSPQGFLLLMWPSGKIIIHP